MKKDQLAFHLNHDMFHVYMENLHIFIAIIESENPEKNCSRKFFLKKIFHANRIKSLREFTERNEGQHEDAMLHDRVSVQGLPCVIAAEIMNWPVE